jgi:Protein of unknown function (DUF3037)
VHDHCTYDYAVVRVVPKVERGEFVNVGIIVSCQTKGFLEARIELDEQRLMALDATLDLESIRTHLAAIAAICTGGEDAGPIGQLSQRQRFHWLVAPRSTIIQTSPVHSGRCANLTTVLDQLLDTMVRTSRAKAPATQINLRGTSEAKE